MSTSTHPVTSPANEKRALLRRLFDQAVSTAQPANCLPAYLPPFPASGRLVVVGAGKSAGAMAEVVEAHYAAHLEPGHPDRQRFSGLVIVPAGVPCAATTIEVAQGSHPLPDYSSVEATQRLLARVQHLTADDRVLVLLSGGASALLCAPISGVSLQDKRAITQQLFAAGASIQELNLIRQCLSAVKGGRLAQACHPAPVQTFAISDVPGDDAALIGSGPTIQSTRQVAEIEAICARYGVKLPQAAVKSTALTQAGPLADNHYHFISRPRDALAAVAEGARAAGYQTVLLGDDIEGEARKVASAMASQILEAAKGTQKTAFISGGEVTVILADAPAGTRPNGGPNREMALALALALNGHPQVCALVADTDGVDGQPFDDQPVAGALIDGTTLEQAAARGLDAKAMLAAHQSGSFFRALGDDLVTGPTRTNVNDLRVVLVN